MNFNGSFNHLLHVHARSRTRERTGERSQISFRLETLCQRRDDRPVRRRASCYLLAGRRAAHRALCGCRPMLPGLHAIGKIKDLVSRGRKLYVLSPGLPACSPSEGRGRVITLKRAPSAQPWILRAFSTASATAQGRSALAVSQFAAETFRPYREVSQRAPLGVRVGAIRNRLMSRHQPSSRATSTARMAFRCHRASCAKANRTHRLRRELRVAP